MKRFGILFILFWLTQNFPNFSYNWENWEYFANFSSRNFLTWFLDFWQNFKLNFGTILVLMFEVAYREGVTVSLTHPVCGRGGGMTVLYPYPVQDMVVLLWGFCTCTFILKLKFFLKISIFGTQWFINNQVFIKCSKLII